MFRTALRNVLAHKARLLITALAITLGVAFVSGTLIFTATLEQTLHQQLGRSYDGVAVAVTAHGKSRDENGASSGYPGIGQKQLDEIRAVPGVASVTGRVTGFAAAGGKNGRMLGEVWSNRGMNFAPGMDGKDPDITLVQGVGPAGAGEIALDAATARAGGHKVGDTVRVGGNGPAEELTLTGIFTTEDGKVKSGGSLILFDTATAQARFLEPGFYNEVFVGATKGTSEQTLSAKIKPLVGERDNVSTGTALAAREAAEIEQSLANVTTVLLAFAGIALFVGVFLIHNTFTMLIAQRTRELALMRAVGATRRQVMRSLLTEAALVGLLSSAAGFALGIAMAGVLPKALGGLGVTMPPGPLVVAPATVVVSLAVGVAVTVLSAWLPARRSTRIAPVEALGSAHAPATVKSLTRRGIAGGILAAAGTGVVLWGVATGGEDGRMIMALGSALAMAGMMALLPLLARPFVTSLRPAMEKLFGTPGRLAAHNALRNSRRTAVTSASIAIGLTMITTLSVLGVSLGQAIDRESTGNLRAGYRISLVNGGEIQPSLIDAVAKAPEVKAVAPRMTGMLQVEAGRRDVQAVSGVRTGSLSEIFRIKVDSGSLSSLAGGKIALSTAAAAQYGVSVGSSLPIVTDAGKKLSLTVGAVYQQPGSVLSPLMLDERKLAEISEMPTVHAIWVAGHDTDPAAMEEALLKATGHSPAIVIESDEDLRTAAAGTVGMMLDVMYGLLGMALVISVLGVVNTLAMAVHERTQETGMLRAIGLDQARVRSMIRLESVTISLFGAVVGIGSGLFFAWAVGTTLTTTFTDYRTVLPWDRLALFVGAALTVGILAAAWPARVAARTDLLRAVKTDPS